MERLKELEDILLTHCINMSILKDNSPIKKVNAILDTMIGAVVRSGMSVDDVIEFISDVEKDTIIDLTLFEKGGNIDNFINEKWSTFIKVLMRQRSVGLGTPNAASGEGELMFIFSSKYITKPTKGDLLIFGKNIEVKGNGVRITGGIGGSSFRTKTLLVAEKFNLTPNKSKKNNLNSVEIEKSYHQDYWKKELTKLNLNDQKSFISGYLNCVNPDFNTDSDVSELFTDGEINFELLIKKIVKLLYSSQVNDRKFDKFVILGDGSNIKILSDNIKEFSDKIDDGTIGVEKDYFRINQGAAIGWYIS